VQRLNLIETRVPELPGFAAPNENENRPSAVQRVLFQLCSLLIIN